MSEVKIVTPSLNKETSRFGPTEIRLPSAGLFYGGQPPDGIVTVTPMKTRHERLLASVTNDTMFKTMLQIFSECTDLPFPPNELLLMDVMYLMVVLRSISLGHDIEQTMICPRCESKYTHYMRWPDDLDKPPFYTVLPVCGKKFGWRYLFGKDEPEITKRVRKIMEDAAQERDPEARKKALEDLKNIIMVVRMAQAVVSIDGEDMSANFSMRRKIEVLDDLVMYDAQFLETAMRDKQFGFVMETVAVCPECGHETRQDVQPSAEFFRPKINVGGYSRTGIPPENGGKATTDGNRGDDHRPAPVVDGQAG